MNGIYKVLHTVGDALATIAAAPSRNRCTGPNCVKVMDRDQVELAMRTLTTQLVRGNPAAQQLADIFARDQIRLPLLNWPTPCARPLELVVVS